MSGESTHFDIHWTGFIISKTWFMRAISIKMEILLVDFAADEKCAVRVLEKCLYNKDAFL